MTINERLHFCMSNKLIPVSLTVCGGVVWYKVIIVLALSLSLRDKDTLRDRESLTIELGIKAIIDNALKYVITFGWRP